MGPLKGEAKPPAGLRKREPDPVFGDRRPLSKKVLPLVREVGQALAWEAEEERLKRGKKEIDLNHATEVVSKQLLEVYKLASVPTVDSGKGEVKKKVKRLWELRRQVIQNKSQKEFKNTKRRHRKKNHQVTSNWDDLKDTLFEIAVKDENIPKIERPFVTDQRGPRRLVIGELDKIENNKMKRKENIVVAEEKRAQKWEEAKKQLKIKKTVVESDDDEEELKRSEKDPDVVAVIVRRRRKEDIEKEKNAKAAISETADRFNISSAAVAHLANEIRAMDGIITKEDQSKVLYVSKVANMRKKVRSEKTESMKRKRVEGLMFDERIDNTKVCVGEGEKKHKRFRIQKEEHCAVVGFGSQFSGGSAFLGHLTPQEGTGQGLAQAVDQFIQERELEVVTPVTLLTDGCSKMGGYKGGAHACYEELLGVRAQRVFCCSHMCERPFAKMFELYDGKPTGIVV